MDQQTNRENWQTHSNEKNQRCRRKPLRPRFQMRVNTKYAPVKHVDGKPSSCTTDTSLKTEQFLDLYRYLQLTRLVEERLVNLYRQTKGGGGVFRSLCQEGTAGGTAYALERQDCITPLNCDLSAVLAKRIRP